MNNMPSYFRENPQPCEVYGPLAEPEDPTLSEILDELLNYEEEWAAEGKFLENPVCVNLTPAQVDHNAQILTEPQNAPPPPEMVAIPQQQVFEMESAFSNALMNFQRGPPPAYSARTYQRRQPSGKPSNLQNLLQMDVPESRNVSSRPIRERHVKRKRVSKRASKYLLPKPTNPQVEATYTNDFNPSIYYNMDLQYCASIPDLQLSPVYGNLTQSSLSQNQPYQVSPRHGLTSQETFSPNAHSDQQSQQTAFLHPQPVFYRFPQRQPFGLLSPQTNFYSAPQQQQNPMLNALLSQPVEHTPSRFIQQQYPMLTSKENQSRRVQQNTKTARQLQHQTEPQFFSGSLNNQSMSSDGFNRRLQASTVSVPPLSPEYIDTTNADQQWQYGNSNQTPEHNTQLSLTSSQSQAASNSISLHLDLSTGDSGKGSLLLQMLRK